MICIYDNTIFYNIRCNAEEVVKCNMWDKIFLGSETSSNLKYEKKKHGYRAVCRERQRGKSLLANVRSGLPRSNPRT